MTSAPFIPHPHTELDTGSRPGLLRQRLIEVVERLVEASDLVTLEVECPQVLGAPVTVTRRSRPTTRTLAVKGYAIPGTVNLPQGSLWVSAATEDALEQARSWPLLLSALLDSELARHAAEASAQGALEMANRDPATGVGNRRAWEHTLRTETVRSRRSERPLTLMVIDIDGLKAVNDARGHAMGDELILRAAKALSSLRRATDEVCRLGGDEFGIAAPDTDDIQARFLAARVRQGLQEAGVRVSLGFAVSREGFDGHDLWQEADIAMYNDKRSRRPSWDAARAEAEQASLEAVARLPRP